MTWAAFERQAYQAARDWGVQPSEFWAMSPAEWWAEADAKIRESRAAAGGPRIRWTAEEIERVKRGRQA
ncbi:MULTISPECIES: hypothetical protein [Rhodovulum]|uniref:Tail assembly chaperone n=2 Tax=Rhodovulum TaxID=34008 RepID=A0A8E2VHP2_9RHOB|nr:MULTISPECIES: hypothetical protein [Rhodovulum]PTW43894.1 tail assembly chaperone [Rhodovulum kholense]RAP39274.1 hypothetical protein BYZ73_21385 [Rhodovulum viride]